MNHYIATYTQNGNHVKRTINTAQNIKQVKRYLAQQNFENIEVTK